MRVIVTVKDQSLQALLGGFPDRFAAHLFEYLKRFGVSLQARVKEKLSDDVLRVRTGTLRRSINLALHQEPGQVSAIVGTNVEYAAAHEYGYHGMVTVKEHLRRTRTRGKTVLVGNTWKHPGMGEWRKIRGQLTGGEAVVHEHTRMMNLPERSFLRSALREMIPEAQAGAKQAALEALKAK